MYTIMDILEMWIRKFRENWEEAVREEAPEEAVREEAPEEAVREEAPEEAVREEAPEEAVREEAPEEAVREEAPEEAVREEAPEEAVREEAPEEAVREEAPEEAVREEAPEEAVREEAPEEAVPEEIIIDIGDLLEAERIKIVPHRQRSLQVEQLKRDVRRTSEVNERMREKLSSKRQKAEVDHAKIESLLRSEKEKVEKLRWLEEERERISRSLHAERQKVEQLKKEKGKEEEEKERMREELFSERQKVQDLTRKSAEANDDKERISRSLHNEKQKVQDLTRKSAEANDDKERISRSLINERQKVQDLMRKIAEAGDDKERDSRKMNNVLESNSRLQQLIAEQKAVATQMIEEKNNLINTERKKVEDITRICQTVHAENEKLKEENFHYRGLANEQKAQAQATIQNLEAEVIKVEDITRICQTVHAENEKLKEENSINQHFRALANEQKAQAEATIHNLEAEVIKFEEYRRICDEAREEKERMEREEKKAMHARFNELLNEQKAQATELLKSVNDSLDTEVKKVESWTLYCQKLNVEAKEEIDRIKNYCIGLEAERNQLQLALNALKESNKHIYQTSLLERDSINEQIKKEAAIEMEKSMMQIKEYQKEIENMKKVEVNREIVTRSKARSIMIQLKKDQLKISKENTKKSGKKKAPIKKDDKGTKQVKVARLKRITPTDGKSWKRN